MEYDDDIGLPAILSEHDLSESTIPIRQYVFNNHNTNTNTCFPGKRVLHLHSVIFGIIHVIVAKLFFIRRNSHFSFS